MMKNLPHILYIDGDGHSRDRIKQVLADQFHVTAIGSYETCHEILQSQEIDLILSEAFVLGLDRLGIIQVVRALNIACPIVILTDQGTEELAVEALKRGASDYVIKHDTNIEQLPSRLHQSLQVISAKISHRTQSILRQQTQRLQILNEINQAMLATQSVEAISAVTLDQLVRLIPEVQFCVFVLEDEASELIVVNCEGPDARLFRAGQRLRLSERCLNLAKRREEVRIVADTDWLDSNLKKHLLDAEIHAYVALWLRIQDEPIGLLCLGAADVATLTPGRVLIARDVALSLAVAIQNTLTLAAEREQRTFAEALRDIATALTSALGPDEVMNLILEYVGRIAPHDASNIMQIKGDVAHMTHWRGYPVEFTLQRRAFELNSIPNLRRMVETGEPCLASDTMNDPAWVRHTETGRPRHTWTRSYVGAPIQLHGQVVGFLNLNSTIPGFFKRVHAERLQAFANQVAIAIESATLYEQVRLYTTDLEQRVARRTHELNQSKEQTEAILNSTSDAIALMFIDGTLRQVNPRFTEAFSCENGQCPGQSLLAFIHPDSRSAVEAALQKVVATNRPQLLEIVAVGRHDRSFDAEVEFAPVSGDIATGIVCTIRDITARKQVETGLRMALEKERELRELKSRFISMTSHEFRNPLATIRIQTDILDNYHDRLTHEERQERFGKIRLLVRHMSDLLDGVLNIGQLESQKTEFNPTLVDLDLFFFEIVEEVRQTDGIEHDLNYKFMCDEPYGAVDETLMRQIITNLLSNAIKYSPTHTRVQLTIACAGDEILIEVQDEGIGIPLDDRERLFEAFHRAGNVGRARGTGLGLAITYHAVQLHGGSIDFDSEVGEGTTFTVRLPRFHNELPAGDSLG